MLLPKLRRLLSIDSLAMLPGIAAREEYRANPSTVPTALVPLSPHDPKFYYREPEFNFNDPPTRVRQNPIDIRTPEQSNRYTDRQVSCPLNIGYRTPFLQF